MADIRNEPHGSLSGPCLFTHQEVELNALMAETERYRELGWTVIPVSRKMPLVKWSKEIVRSQVDNLIMRGKASGIAVVLGERSGGLVSRDFDHPMGRSIWKEANPVLAETLPTSVSGSGRGHHVYAYCETPTRVRKFDRRYYGDLTGEIRGEGGINLLPPSIHPSGNPYFWESSPFVSIPTIEGPSDLSPPGSSLKPYRDVLRNTNRDATCLLFLQSKELDLSDPMSQLREDLASHLPRKFSEDWVVESIETTVPSGPGQRVSRLYDFARRLKVILPQDADDALLKGYCEAWYARAYDRIGTKGFWTTWRDFREAWKNSGTFGEVLSACHVAAKFDTTTFIEKEEPLSQLLWRKERFGTRAWRNANLVARAFRAVARHWDWEEFYIGARELGFVAGISSSSAHRAAVDLEEIGLVTRTRVGSWAPGGGLSSHWVWNGERD